MPRLFEESKKKIISFKSSLKYFGKTNLETNSLDIELNILKNLVKKEEQWI